MLFFFFFKQKTAYERRISDWSSDVCASDLLTECTRPVRSGSVDDGDLESAGSAGRRCTQRHDKTRLRSTEARYRRTQAQRQGQGSRSRHRHDNAHAAGRGSCGADRKSTSELQSLMRKSYAVFWLDKENNKQHTTDTN